MCRNLQNDDLEGDALLKAIYNAVSVYYNFTGSAKCYDIEHQATKDLGDKGWAFQVSQICMVGLPEVRLHVNRNG